MNKVYLLLGSNLGERKESIHKAVSCIEAQLGKILVTSSLYETEPWGLQEQPLFLNQVIWVETKLNAASTLEKILQIENQLGRIRNEKWSERKIDIDILYFNNEILVRPGLKIPHPEIHNRRFTLVPLCEIADDFKHPIFNISNAEMLKRCGDKLEVKRV